MIESLPNPERFREVRSSQPGYTRTLTDVAGGTRMTREKNSQNDNGSRGDDSHIWGTVGVVVGGVLAFKVLSAMGVRENEDLTLVEITTAVALLFGPVYVKMKRSERAPTPRTGRRWQDSPSLHSHSRVSQASTTLLG